MSEQPQKNENKAGEMLSLSSLGINLVASTVIGLGGGILLDKLFSTKPYLTLAGFFLGVFSGFWQIFEAIKKLNGNKRDKTVRQK